MPTLRLTEAIAIFDYTEAQPEEIVSGRVLAPMIARPNLNAGIGAYNFAVYRGGVNDVQGTLDVRDYGADDTGVADSTGAINAALEAGYSSGQVVVGLGGTFRISGTVNIRTTCDFYGSDFVGDSGVSLPIVRIADDDAYLKRLRNIQVRLPRIWKDTDTNMPLVGGESTWPNDDDGVLIEGLSRSVVWFDLIHSVRNGIHIRSTSEYNTGTDFNQFFITEVDSCQTNLWLDVTTRDTEPGDVFGGNGERGGWINENRFYGGCLRHERATFTSLPATGVTQIKLTGFCTPGLAYGRPGANTFDYVSIEGNTHEYAIVCEGEYNIWRNCRLERFNPFPEEKIMLRVPPNYPTTDPAWRYATRNVFQLGRAYARLWDPADDYGSFEKVNYDAGTVYASGYPRTNFVQDTSLVGNASDLGAGWVEI